ncbi:MULTISPECIES: peroxide stress protein YaaA [Idiomarina]|uniref:peroxide stress protein YaaA n=1 Tax=Idiomarina TaxID=135575 RepID=UPI000C59E418|nr:MULTISPECIES: peroxide stress protein YaaA [Idiomarina]MBH94077.1 peroxide stress protein YaaA [Idiomarina sp.]|tara:strand:- start:273 stop:1049 length:777 start_codon:yes stop_codon:yes gene_type:complete
MLAVVSPAKNLDYESNLPSLDVTQPRLLDNAEELVKVCRQLSPQQLGSLMKISDKLAGLNAARFEQWQRPFNEENARPAMFAFNGDVYTGLDAVSLNSEAINTAQQQLRILSGLYGVLRPLDLMQPYRLEMGTKLDNPKGKNLYEYWGDTITELLNDDLARLGSSTLVNLASNEYFSAVKPKALNADIITPVFKDEKNGQYKVISFYAKKARGLMARFIVNQKPKSVSDLKEFDASGYRFNEAMSSDKQLVFCRAEQK